MQIRSYKHIANQKTKIIKGENKMSEEKRQPKTKEELNALKEKKVETVSKKLHKLTDEELAQVSGGMNIGKVPAIGISEGLSSLSLPDMVAELEKRGLANLGGAVATPGGGASQLINEGCMGIDPRNESGANPFSRLENVDTLNNPPTPPSPVAESVKNAVDAAIKLGK